MEQKVLPLVHAIETSGAKRMPRAYRDFSVKHCQAEIDATREAYALMPEKNRQKRLDQYDTCRTRAWFVRHRETGELRVAAKSCKLRWCPLCAHKRSYFLVEQIKPWAESVSMLKFFTLTLKHSNAPLHDQVDNLYKFFQQFRKLRYLKDNMHGGVWFFQIKKSKASGQWHPHLHCLIDANYMAREKLSQLWQRTTGTSMVVDIRKAGDTAKVAEYVGRYSARPSTLAELELADRVEVVAALHRRRLLGTWGTAKYNPVREYRDEQNRLLDGKPDDLTGVTVTDVSYTGIATAMKKPPDAHEWERIGSWTSVWGCLDSDENAKAIFEAWRKDEPLADGVTMGHIEAFIEGYETVARKERPESRQMWLTFSGPLPF